MNLILLCSDAHNYQKTGCYGDPCAITPNLDSIAQNGTLFQNAYCNNPICVPSRASFITGEYGHKHNFWDNAHPYSGEVKGFGHVLTQHGVEVTTIGKLHFKDEKSDTGLPDQRLALHVKNGKGDLYGSARLPQCRKAKLFEELTKAHTGSSDYTEFDTRVAKAAADFLTNEAPQKKEPWLLYVGFVCPHFPLTVPQEFYDLYEGVTLPDPIQFSQEERPHHPVLELMRYYHGSTDADLETTRKIIRHYYALISFMDYQVGVVLEALRRSGLGETTRVLYTSDHGDSVGDHGMFFKHNMYDSSAGVPLLLQGDGIPRGARNNTPVSLVDIYPTVLDCFGIRGHREGKDGASLFQFLDAPDPERTVFSEYHAGGAITAEFMLRKGRYKLITYLDYPSMLFDLQEDPNELTNLAENPDYQQILQKCQLALRAICDPEEVHHRCRKDQLAMIEQDGGMEQLLTGKSAILFSPVPKPEESK